MTNLPNQLLPQFISNQSEILQSCCRHTEVVHLSFEIEKVIFDKITAFSNSGIFGLWLIQNFLEDWAVGGVRSGQGDRHSIGTSSVFYGHNFIVYLIFDWN